MPDTNTLTLYRAATTAHTQLWLVPGAGHADSYRWQPQVYALKVLAFFRRYLGG